MKDHEIIAILENCDDAQRARILAWARKRWPKKGAAASPAAPVLTERDREDMLKKILGAPQDRTIAQPPPWVPPIILTEPPRTAPPTEPDWTPDPGRPYKVTCMAVGGPID